MDRFDIEIEEKPHLIDINFKKNQVSYELGVSNQAPNDHAKLVNLDYEHSGHTGFLPSTAKISDLKDDTYYKSEFDKKDWIQSGNIWYILITQSEHMLKNPYVQELLIVDDGGYTNCFYSYKVLPNNTIEIISDDPVAGRFIIRGDV